jgi:hypothetical protein
MMAERGDQLPVSALPVDAPIPPAPQRARSATFLSWSRPGSRTSASGAGTGRHPPIGVRPKACSRRKLLV